MRESAEQRLWKAIVITMLEDVDDEIMNLKNQLSVLGGVFDSSVHLIYRLLSESKGHWFQHICSMADRDHDKVVEYLDRRVDELDLPNQKMIRDRAQFRRTDFGRFVMQ